MTNLVMFLDPEEKPRAWGIHTNLEVAVQSARFHLAVYRDEKRALQDPLFAADYTMKVMQLP